MTRARIILLVAIVALVAPAAPVGAYQGSSLYDNVSPRPQVNGLSERYPLSHYGLDRHVDAGIESTDVPLGVVGAVTGIDVSVPTDVNLEDAPELMWHAVASAVWDFTKMVSAFVITLFTFAFSLDLISGAGGALRPIRQAMNDLYSAVGTGWMAAALVIVGGIAVWRMVAQRQIIATFGQLGLSFLYVFVALLIITQTGWVVGGGTRLTNEISVGILDELNRGDEGNAKTAAADALHRTLIHDPWLVLNFGGTEHCVDKDNKPVKPSHRACETRIDHRKKYADRWLKAGAANSKPRDLEYKALRDGKLPDGQAVDDADLPDDYFDGYTVSAADKPAVDIQQAPPASDRLGAAVIVLIGVAGAWLLVGGLAIGVIIATLMFLLFLVFTPLAMIAALFPGFGHVAFKGWLERFIFALTRKIWYALLLAVVLMIAGALTVASTEMGWSLAFGLQAFFFWAVFLGRKELYRALTAAVGSRGVEHQGKDFGDRVRDAYYTQRMVRPGFRALADTTRRTVRGTRHATEKGAGGAAGAVRDATRAAADTANATAGGGHAAQVIAAGALAGQAIESLERDYDNDVKRHSAETANRTRVSELMRRQQIARDGAFPEAESVALTREEERDLARLQANLMPKEEYDGLRDRVHDVDRRRRESGGVAFSEAEVAQRARDLAERDRSRPDYTRTERLRDERDTGRADDMDEIARRAREHSRTRLFDDGPEPVAAKPRGRRWRREREERDDR